jgi:two-component system LytT family sensor kinase
VWWFIFIKMGHKSAAFRYALHILTLPAWLLAWITTFYLLCDLWDLGRLRGYGVGWDIYIPTLFYGIQFGIFHLYDESRRLLRQKTQSLELQNLSVKNELAALKAQLNPHFLYNVFNTINASLPPGQEEAREMVATLSDLFRYQLRASRSETVSLQEELDFVQGYLMLEKARFQDRLQVAWEIDDAMRRVPVPPMLLQPLVENAVRHGISPKVEGGKITIRAIQQDGALRMEIEDDGVGLQKESLNPGEGVGLQNITKMLDSLYGEKLSLINNASGGLTAGFSIPINKPIASK